MKIITTLISFYFLILFAATLKAEEVQVKNILAFKTADWNRDGAMDKAVLALAKSNDDTDVTLYIYLSEGEKKGSTLKKRNISWTGTMAGTVPTLTINKSGSLVIHTMNESIGRDRWHQKATVAYRNNAFIVTGFSFSSRDTLDHDNYHECNVNLLNGEGEKDGKPFRVERKIHLLLDWDNDHPSKKCFD